MELSQEWVYNNIVERYGLDYVNEYGEPGYQNFGTAMVILGDFWCRCGHNPREGQPKGWNYTNGETVQAGDLHDYAAHHPRVWEWMEHNGFELEWSDEWVIDHEHGKCYRTSADSYTWTPTAIITEWGDLLTPDTPIDEWIAWAVNDPQRCLMPEHSDRLEEVGFVNANDTDRGWGGDSYEAGSHPGQDANPKQIFAELFPDHDEVVFVLDYNSQFYSGFSVYTRDANDREEVK